MTTFPIEMQGTSNFGHITTSTIEFESRDKILLVISQTEFMMSWPLFQNTFTLRWPRVSNFADTIKIATMFMKATFKNSEKKSKRMRNYALKCNLHLYILI